MIENPNPACLREGTIQSFQDHLLPAGFEIKKIPAKFVLKPSRFRVGSLDLGLLVKAWFDDDSELATLLSNRHRMGYARPDKGFIVLKREDPVTEIHELTHMWQGEVNPEFTDSTQEIIGKNPLTQKILIRHMVREGIAVWNSFALTLASGDPGAEAAALERLAFLERNKEKKYRNVNEVTTGFPSNIKPVHFRVSHYTNAVKQMGYDAYTAGLFYVNARMIEEMDRICSIPQGLAGIMEKYPDEIGEVLELARSAPEISKISFRVTS